MKLYKYKWEAIFKNRITRQYVADSLWQITEMVAADEAKLGEAISIYGVTDGWYVGGEAARL